ncbi:MAG TPA: hypothetical protein VNG51_21290 [Ktedonobacteraceae bacterium]|nr:hypothetical protein [Ktedonobacteraceae bacterium]
MGGVGTIAVGHDRGRPTGHWRAGRDPGRVAFVVGSVLALLGRAVAIIYLTVDHFVHIVVDRIADGLIVRLVGPLFGEGGLSWHGGCIVAGNLLLQQVMVVAELIGQPTTLGKIVPGIAGGHLRPRDGTATGAGEVASGMLETVGRASTTGADQPLSDCASNRIVSSNERSRAARVPLLLFLLKGGGNGCWWYIRHIGVLFRTRHGKAPILRCSSSKNKRNGKMAQKVIQKANTV